MKRKKKKKKKKKLPKLNPKAQRINLDREMGAQPNIKREEVERNADLAKKVETDNPFIRGQIERSLNRHYIY